MINLELLDLRTPSLTQVTAGYGSPVASQVRFSVSVCNKDWLVKVDKTFGETEQQAIG